MPTINVRPGPLLIHLRRHPGFAAGAAISLGLGMALATTVFSMVDALYLRPLPFDQPDRLMRVYKTAAGGRTLAGELNARDLVAVRGNTTSFSDVAAWRGSRPRVLGQSGDARTYGSVAVTSNLFDVLRVRPSLGRLFNQSDAAAGVGGPIVITNALWQTRFAGDSGIVGKTMLVDGVPRVVIGVLPAKIDTWAKSPLWLVVANDTLRAEADRGDMWYMAIGRLASAATREAATAQLGVLSHRTEPTTGAAAPQWHVVPLSSLQQTDAVQLWIAAGVLVMILCAVNFATMMLARGMKRRGEIAVRSALGASAPRIVGLLVSEAALIASIGGIIAVLLATWGPGVVRASFGDSLPSALAGISWRAAAFGLAGTALVGFLVTLLPAIELSRADLRPLLSGATAGVTTSERELRGRRGLVALQIGLALACVAVVGSVVQADLREYAQGEGYSYENVLTADISVTTPAAWSEPALLSQVRAVAGVEDAAVLRSAEVNGFLPENAAPGVFPHLLWSDVGTNYFATKGIPLLAGRLPTVRDAELGAPVALVSRQYEHWQMSVGSRMRMTTPDGRKTWYTVIGIVDDVRDIRIQGQFRRWTVPIYTVNALSSLRAGAALVVRVRGDPHRVLERLRAALRDYDGRIIVTDLRAAYDEVARLRAVSRGRLIFVTSVGVLSLVLAVIGVYALTSYTATLRMREIAIRKALGASDRRIVTTVAGDLTWMAGLGSLLGLTLGVYVVQTLDAFVRNPLLRRPLISFPVVPSTIAALALVVIALIGVLLPARRALRMDIARVVASGG